MTRILAALVLAGLLAGCGGGDDKPAPKVEPISQTDLHTVVTVICAESLPNMDRILNSIDRASNARYVRVLTDMHRTCPDQLNELVTYVGG